MDKEKAKALIALEWIGNELEEMGSYGEAREREIEALRVVGEYIKKNG